MSTVPELATGSASPEADLEGICPIMPDPQRSFAAFRLAFHAFGEGRPTGEDLAEGFQDGNRFPAVGIGVAEHDWVHVVLDVFAVLAGRDVDKVIPGVDDPFFEGGVILETGVGRKPPALPDVAHVEAVSHVRHDTCICALGEELELALVDRVDDPQTIADKHRGL